MSRRYWLITYNNPPEDWKAALQQIGSDWAIGQLEQGESGTVHIQALLWFRDRVRNTFWKGKACWSKAIKTEDVERTIEYVTKVSTRRDGPFTFGVSPLLKSGGVRTTKKHRDFDAALDLTKKGRIKEIEADILIPYIGNLQKVATLFATPLRVQLPRGVWVYGKPGMGKSYYVRDAYTDIYYKPQNKWWDGYTGQSTVLLDDLDEFGSGLGHLLKIWLDEYEFMGEIKGGSVVPVYTTFVITSNKLPSQLWSDNDMVEAITRRCRFVVFYSQRVPTIGTEFGVIPQDPAQHDMALYFSSFISQ